MALDLKSLYLTGTCDLTVDEVALGSVHCRLNLETQSLDCFAKDGRLASHGDDKVDIDNLRLSSPYGILHANRVLVSFFGSRANSGWSSTETSLSNIFLLNGHVDRCSCVINDPIHFLVETQNDLGEERLYFPGIDLAFPVGKPDGLKLIGSKDYTSLTDPPADPDVARMALSIALGVPAREFASIAGKSVVVTLNNFGNAIVPRPLVFCGWPYRDAQVAGQNLLAVFEKATSYLECLPEQARAEFIDAVTSYLQARSIKGSYEVTLLAAFHFLEWLDQSRTMIKNSVAAALDITMDEAEQICKVRNNLAHNLGNLRGAVEAAEQFILETGVTRIELIHGGSGAGFLNYIMTGLGKALLAKIGYDGASTPFMPPFTQFNWTGTTDLAPRVHTTNT